MSDAKDAFLDSNFVPLLPEGARWGDISDVEEQETATAAAVADDEDDFETDPKRLTARQQQIDFGKNTLGYERYLQAVPKHKRKLRGKDHDPPTPDITQKMSKRTWDGIVKSWRRHLHKYDNIEAQQPAAAAPGINDNPAAAADMQVDAAAARDAPRSAPNPAGSGKHWQASSNKRHGSKQQNSNQGMRQDTASQQGQQCRPAAEEDGAPQPQQQQQTGECGRQHSRHGSDFGNCREGENSRGRGSGSGGSEAGRRPHHNGNRSRRDSRSRHSYQSRHSNRPAAAAGHGVTGEHDSEYGQPPRHSSSNTARSGRHNGHASGRDGGASRSGNRSQQQPRDRQGWQPRDAAGKSAAAAAETSRRAPDSAAAAGSCCDVAPGASSGQLTPAKRGSSSQDDVDKRPPKHS
ncbi:histone RNA hairpin-binding protein RNA-binding domain-containing protein [Scenedesmus sp. NREL 46B-D3]|nr:histone RNA hairpin-binding protein RNA-binding domain-containing protein [Scenedesmus sp. NREL 46B-D3]